MPSTLPLISPVSFAAGIVRFAKSSLAFIAADFLLAGIVCALGGAYWLERSLSLHALATMAVIILSGHALSLTYQQRQPARFIGLPGRLILGHLFALALYCALRSQLGGLVSRPTFACFLGVFALLQAGWHLRYRSATGEATDGGIEYLRWMLVTVAALFLHRPLLTTGSVGAGDAYWYSIMTADFVSQWREGIFPVFAGQTEFAFNGAISPLRFAPALQHFAGMIDLVTWHSLSFHGILNLTLVSAYVGGALTCYGCLRLIEPRVPWLALVLSLLFSACPGVLALAYVGDLFMSITTLPFVPVLLYGVWRTLTKGDLKGVLIMVAAAAALWYCHPPIALWGTIIAAIAQIARLSRDGGKLETWRNWLIGAACFGVLSLYCFVSVKSLGIPAYPAFRPVIIENLQSAFPGALRPLSKTMVALSDYQLGWALWGALLAGIAGLCFTRPRMPAFAFFAAIVTLLAFLLPIPWLLAKLWMSMPQVIVDITFMWPMQRFYVLLAGLVVFLAFATLGPFCTRRRYGSILLLAVFLSGAAWSGIEALKFHRHAVVSITTPAQASQQLFLQNCILTRYSFNPFRRIPPYFSHGFIDPLLQNRLLAPVTFAEIVSNSAIIEDDPAFGIVRAEGTLAAFRTDPAAPTLDLKPILTLEPNRHYALKLEFDHPEFVGGLKIRGARMSRFYWLPDSAYDVKTTSPSKAFGTRPGQRRSITLWTDRAVPEEISLHFYFSGEGPANEVKTFGRYTLREFDPSQLPISVEKWAPYRARVKAPGPALLETPRLFLDGYQARVNGRAVVVQKSPDSLVMFPVPAGESTVELSYSAPWAVRTAYFFSLGGWLLLIAWWGREKWRTRSSLVTL